jgi:hypothetical protein
MGETPAALGKPLLGSKPLAAIGVVLIITGGMEFLNYLASGGAYFPADLVISGAVLIVVDFEEYSQTSAGMVNCRLITLLKPCAAPMFQLLKLRLFHRGSILF